MGEHRLLGITMGDPSGIGPEIIVKLFEQTPLSDCLVYGDPDWISATAKSMGSEIGVDTLDRPDANRREGFIPVIASCDPLPATLPIGHVSPLAGKAAYQCVQRAIDDALSGVIAGIVTAPLNKQAIHQAGFNFPGHTEILAHRSGDVPVAMMLANDVLRVVLVTIHIPLAAVAQTITTGLELQAIELANQACLALGVKAPRIAVAGLNPHASEGGKFGTEERAIIEPAIAQAQAKGLNVSGPWPGDTIFGRARAGEFDVVVAQYHDQGLIPIKYLGLDQGVNITIGLPFVRTSVDHGTAFDIAGKGLASPESLNQAVRIARTLAQHRT